MEAKSPNWVALSREWGNETIHGYDGDENSLIPYVGPAKSKVQKLWLRDMGGLIGWGRKDGEDTERWKVSRCRGSFANSLGKKMGAVELFG